jgi:ABC-type dipeptide/oligopeptide/nickel transport system permease subunit
MYWFSIWIIGLIFIWSWNLVFLNKPALKQLESGFLNTLIISFLVIIFSILFGWGTTILHYLLERNYPRIQIILIFFINIIRSIPQIVGILMGYVVLTVMIQQGILRAEFHILVFMALIIAVFVFLEIFDLLRERIGYYRRLDFFDAMRVCGIKERYIINREIIWRSSRIHMMNKMIAIFGISIFLLCSVDFIISVGLSTDVSSVNLPVTLGSLLAKIDSKQDILAIGYSLTHLGYVIRLPFEHLQGISVSFIIVFTLVCMYQIGIGFARRHRL